jgi:2-polyprenyl-3-methyl-5-hydroxy-6-metoxy-1,4-benzoquinol methylase
MPFFEKAALKKIVINFLKFFQIYRILHKWYHWTQYVFVKTRLLFTRNRKSNTNILNIPLERIFYADFKREGQSRPIDSANMYRVIGKILGGDWDLERIPIEDLKIYKALSQYFLLGIDLRKTDFYVGRAKNKEKVSDSWFYLYEDNFEEEVARFTALYKSIKENGYKSQKELGSANKLDEIRVKIDRHGEFLFENSIHRLIIAKILKVKSVPVLVTVRHAKWAKLKKELRALSQGSLFEGNGKLYQKLPHPDLWDIPYAHEGDDRIEIMRRRLEFMNRGNALDIGANLGFFCHKLEDMGFRCYAVEFNEILAHYMKVLRKVEKKRFEVVTGDILDNYVCSQICSRSYSVVLALNILHHFIKQRDLLEKLKMLLGKLNTKSMIFEAHDPNEPQMREAYRNFESEEFVRFIIENSCLVNYECLGTTSDGRKLYFIQK